MIIYIDIDDTICTHPSGGGYEQSYPFPDEVAKVNAKYEAGHHIVYWTARGALTGKDLRELTEKQLKAWGCKYHTLRLDKPYYDIFIDDKAYNNINALAYVYENYSAMEIE